jgi:hypothetical protein
MRRSRQGAFGPVRLVVASLIALAIATPASAQFGGLKKKVRKAAGAEQQEASASGEAPADAQGGTIVLTPDVLNQLLTGLRAGQAERDAAAKEDSPYGRYKKAEAAYAVAQPKCEAAQQTWPQRAAANQKMLDKYSALTEKMVAAQGKGDMKLMTIYQDSAMAMMDPSCVVKKPDQPKEFYEAERASELRAEKAEVKASGLSGGELALVKERAIALLSGSTPADASGSEKSAVSARAAELKPLLGFKQPTPVRTAKATPAPAPAPAAANPQMSAGTSDMSSCMTNNMQNHQAEIEALSKRAQAAQKAGDQTTMMAIADTLRQIQMAGCQMGR